MPRSNQHGACSVIRIFMRQPLSRTRGTRPMKDFAIRGLVAVAALTMLAVAAVPASATITPVNARISASSTDTQLAADDGSLTVRCPIADVTVTNSADGRTLSGNAIFTRNARTRATCEGSGPGIPPGTSADDINDCRITLRSVSSLRNTNASFDLRIDGGCTVRVPGIGVTITVDVQTVANCVTFSQATQSLTVRCPLRVRAGAIARTATFSGSFSVSRPARLTVS